MTSPKTFGHPAITREFTKKFRKVKDTTKIEMRFNDEVKALIKRLTMRIKMLRIVS